MAKITILYLADVDEAPALLGDTVRTQKEKLRLKFDGEENEVITFKGVELVKAVALGNFELVDMPKIREACASSVKVLVAVHGFPGSADFGKCITKEKDPMREGKVITYEIWYHQVAKLMLDVLQEESRAYRLSLVMCYGARSQDPKKNHETFEDVGDKDLASSFAYKFFRCICTQRHVIMTARTGELGFYNKDRWKQIKDLGDHLDYHSLVESETSIMMDLLTKELKATQKEIKEQGGISVQSKYNKYFAHVRALERAKRLPLMAPKGPPPEGWQEWLEGEEPTGGSELLNSQYYRGELEIVKLSERGLRGEWISGASRMKYGTIVYLYDDDVLVITSKYGGENRTEKLLYKGELL